ncbi:NTP transferase domain-containing protein [Bacillus subtilis]|uniref:nucleotidyltransferase family protein n=1 Tax=Bacillus subtilis group TaxID=653685 RepID=UPI0022E33569|nr:MULTISPECIES: nucleotidyltransferase family protein [Bacillus subtilis group]MEC1686917.1 nucleotidyltransferase family protein [Bacillus mojavensis]
MCKKIETVILAAGMSKRLRTKIPKQLLKFGEDAMLIKVIKTAIEARCFPITLVLGYRAEAIIKEIPARYASLIRIRVNKEFTKGLSTSIKAGISPGNETLVMLGDQPFITKDIIHSLIKTYQKHRKTTRPMYGYIPLHPILLSSRHTSLISKTEGDKGLKELLKNDQTAIHYVQVHDISPFIDIDTSKTYEIHKWRQ